MILQIPASSDLARKIEELRSDPAKRAELIERIAAYRVYLYFFFIAKLIINSPKFQQTKLRNLTNKNVVEENKNVSRYTPEIRAQQLRDSIASRERHMESVLDSKKEITEEVLQRRLAIVHRKEIEAIEEERNAMGYLRRFVVCLN